MKNKYSKEEINILKNNPNVLEVKYGRQIEYKPEFKKWAVYKSYDNPELSAIQIFELAGFDRRIISSRNARSRLNSWKKNFKIVKINTYSDTSNKKMDYSQQNNILLITLLSKFDRLLEVISTR